MSLRSKPSIAGSVGREEYRFDNDNRKCTTGMGRRIGNEDRVSDGKVADQSEVV